MLSLSAIPEPSNNAPDADASDAPQVPLTSSSIEGQLAVTHKAQSNTEHHDVDQQIDGFAILLVLLIAGALLRLVLGLLGPLQQVNTAQAEHAQHQGKQILAGDAGSAWPLFDLVAYGLATSGVPAWGLVLLGSVLTLCCVPAAYGMGCTLTGRRTAGLFAAAVVAVHPAALTASNSYASPALALGLVTIGLACVCLVERKSGRVAIIGSVLLGCAALTAPFAWLVGVLAGPLTYKLTRHSGAGKALSLAVIITLTATAPPAVYRAAFLGQSPGAFLAEWNPEQAGDQTITPLQHLLVTMANPSFTELGQAMHLPLKDAGRLKVTHAAKIEQGNRDVVADTLADGWLLLNAALAVLATISIGVMIARRRLAETMILAMPLLALAFTALPPGETLRLPMLGLVGVLAAGMFATRPVTRIEDAAIESKRMAKRAKREAKERAKQEYELQKHKQSLYAFDKPDMAKRLEPTQTDEPSEPPQQTINTQQNQDAPTLIGRPI